MQNNPSLKNTTSQLWHSLSVEDTLEILDTSVHGLAAKEIHKRRRSYGANELPELKQRGVLQKILSQCNNVLIYILLASATTTLFLSHFVEASVILTVIILNVIISYIQENKAEKALKALQDMLPHQATVMRNGKRLIVNAKLLIPGDIVMLRAGDKIPADLRLFNLKSLQIQEGILTGESIPVNKSPISVLENTALADRTSMAYSGTLVTYGVGEGIVVATGQQTEIGRISQLTSGIIKFQTPLLQQINIFGKWLTAAILTLSVVTFLIGFFIWHDTSVALFLAVVGLAVAAIPEGLPAIMTITFAIGVTRMAKRNAIIRHLPAIETTGAITTICSDKTGTLTCNELAVRCIVTAEHEYNITGNGYNDIGELHLNNSPFSLEQHPDLCQLIRVGSLCNDAELIKNHNKWELLGNPVDGAFLALRLKSKINFDAEKKSYPRVDFIPFDSKHKFMASLHYDQNGNGYIFVKGAPERILAKSKHELFHNTTRSINVKHWEDKIHALATQGQRLLGIAIKYVNTKNNKLTFQDVDDDLILIGIVGLIDPPRVEAIAAIAKCQSAGIRVKMITGDHAVTARAIAEQVGIKNYQQVITGDDIDRLDDAALALTAQEVDIYARTSPEHKLRLVQALQKNGEIVAMTGDGVNDVPALKQANIGIAMGRKGSEVSKEVADMVLADDNFASIVHAIEEGRTIYDNMRKSLLFLLPTNGGEALIIVTAIIFGNLLPISATQILWVNMVTAVTFALAIAFEPAEDNVMQRPPRKVHEPILSGWFIWRIIFSLSLMTISGYVIFLYERSINTDIMAARCAVVNMVVVAEFVYLINSRKLYSSIWSLKSMFNNTAFIISAAAVILLQITFTYLPSMEHFFSVSPIEPQAWIRIFLLGIAMLIAVRLERFFISGRKLNLLKK